MKVGIKEYNIYIMVFYNSILMAVIEKKSSLIISVHIAFVAMQFIIMSVAYHIILLQNKNSLPF